MDAMWSLKLGLESTNTTTKSLVASLLVLMEKTEADWTMTWRQLAVVVERMSSVDGGSIEVKEMLETLSECFYSEENSPLNVKSAHREEWMEWLSNWYVVVFRGVWWFSLFIELQLLTVNQLFLNQLFFSFLGPMLWLRRRQQHHWQKLQFP